MMKPNQIFLCPSLPIGEPHRVAVLKKSGEADFPKISQWCGELLGRDNRAEEN
jgi:hypothetical protein